MKRLLSFVIVAVIFFAAGWFGSRTFYAPLPVEAPVRAAWYGGACTEDVPHLVVPTDEGKKVLDCTATFDDVVALFGPPHQQHVVATSAGQRTLLFYYVDSDKQLAPRAWLALANDKLLAAYTLNLSSEPLPEEE